MEALTVVLEWGGAVFHLGFNIEPLAFLFSLFFHPHTLESITINFDQKGEITNYEYCFLFLHLLRVALGLLYFTCRCENS